MPLISSNAKSDARLRHKLITRARRFDVASLFAALHTLGFAPEDVVFKSRHGASRPSSLVHAVELRDRPLRCAVVTLNMGLLGSESPLPSYMKQLIENAPERLVPFFELLDQALLSQRLRSLAPERDRAIMADWDAALRSLGQLMRLCTPTGAHWLFRRVFPELRITVARAARRRHVDTRPVIVGDSAIDGTCTLGSGAAALTGTLAVQLVADDAVAGNRRPWQDEAKARLEQALLPRLQTPLVLTVTLFIRDRPNQLRLGPGNHLGLQPLHSGPDGVRVILHDGPV